MADRNPHGVAVGQVWADNDRRSTGRMIRVVAVVMDIAVAFVQACDSDGRSAVGARVTRIRLDRFRSTSTGYRLVMTVGGER